MKKYIYILIIAYLAALIITPYYPEHARLTLIFIGAFYFIRSLSNQDKTFKLNLKQKKIDEANNYITNLEKIYIEIAQNIKDQCKIPKKLIDNITFTGEKTFNFLEFHRTLF